MVTKPLPSTSSFRRISLPLWAPIFSLLEILPDSAGRVFDGDVKAELHLAERIQLGPPCPRRHKPPVDDPAPRGLQRALQHHLRHRSGRLLRLGKPRLGAWTVSVTRWRAPRSLAVLQSLTASSPSVRYSASAPASGPKGGAAS